MIIQKNSLVVYKNRPALVVETSPDLQIKSDDGGLQKVRTKDIILLHPGPVSGLAGLEPPEADVETAWEILSGDAVTLRELAEVVYGRFTPAAAWGAWQLVSDGLYFQGTPEHITGCSREEIIRRQESRRQKTSQKAAWAGFMSRLAGRQLIPEDGVFLADVEAVALGESQESRVMRELGRSQTPQNAHALLVELGRWDRRFNPYPRRFGVPLAPPVIGLPELPEEKRTDLTHLPAFAIDNAWTNDPDDAISLEGFDRLWVHVADVAALVPADSPVDLEARNRSASLYLPEVTVPMLPLEASERLGLGLREVSPALSFGLKLDAEGVILGVDIVPSWVRVTRLTYDQVEEKLTEMPFEKLLSIAQNNEARRKSNGAVSIDLPETDIRVENGGIVFRTAVALKSQTIVRETMLMAGEAAAAFAVKEGISLVFSTQQASQVPFLPEGLAGMYALRRLMKRGQLKSAADRHAGTGLKAYSQVTSPLRRYQDLISHQQLRAHLRGGTGLTAEDIVQRLGAAEEVMNNLRQVERLSNQHWTTVYLAETPQWRGQAVIVEIEGNRATALVPGLGMETRLHCPSSLPLNTSVPIVVAGANVPELSSYFRVENL